MALGLGRFQAFKRLGEDGNRTAANGCFVIGCCSYTVLVVW